MGWAVFQSTVQDAAGNVVPNAEITVRREISGLPLVALKPNSDGSGSLSNPFNADSNGFFRFYVEGGGFFYIEASSGSVLVGGPLRNVPIGTMAGLDESNLSVGNLTVGGLVALSGDITPSQISSNQNDYNPSGLSTASVLRLSSDASRNITGLQGGSDGRIISIHNVGSQSIILKDEDTGSAAGNRFALTGDITITPDSVAVLQYDSTSLRWRAVSGGGGDSQVREFETRAAAIAATIPIGVQAVRVTRFASGHPVSNATYIPGTVSGPMAFQEAGGHYWELDLSSRVIDVHWFGAVPSPLGTAAASVTNCRTEVQAALNYIGAQGGGRLQFSPGVYNIGDGIAVTLHDTYIQGAGLNNTILLHRPTSPGGGVVFSTGISHVSAGILSNTGIYDLSIESDDTTILKIGIIAVDVSQFNCKNVIVCSYPNGTGLYRGSGGSFGVGLQTQGRELGIVEDCQFYANIPINLAANPNVSGGTSDLDSWTFRDLILMSDLTSATKNVIQCDCVSLNNIKFTGHQNWIGGIDGFHWTSGSTSIAIGLEFEGVKSEQTNPITGYTINIQNASVLYNFRLSGMSGGERNGIKLRGVFNAIIENVYYDHNVGGVTGLDVNNTCSVVDLRNCAWISGTTISTTGLTALTSYATPSGMAYPANKLLQA